MWRILYKICGVFYHTDSKFGEGEDSHLEKAPRNLT